MAITSSSTKKEVLAQYNDNLGWDNDITKARLALEAIRWLLINRETSMSINGRSISYTSLEAEKKMLERYIIQENTVNNTNSSRSTFTRGFAKQW